MLGLDFEGYPLFITHTLNECSQILHKVFKCIRLRMQFNFSAFNF